MRDPSTGLNGQVAAVLRGELAARTERMTHRHLAAVTGIPLASLRRYLNGERMIRLAVLDSISEALDLSPSWVFQQADERLKREQKRVTD